MGLSYAIVIRTFGNLLCLSQQLLRFLLHSDSVVKILLVEEVFQYRSAILNPYKRINMSFKVEASWKYPKNPRKTSHPKNGGYNPSKASQHRNRKNENDFGHMDDFVQVPTAPRQMPRSGTLDLGHPTLLQNASKKHLKSSKQVKHNTKHMGRYQTTFGVERSVVWNLIA